MVSLELNISNELEYLEDYSILCDEIQFKSILKNIVYFYDDFLLSNIRIISKSFLSVPCLVDEITFKNAGGKIIKNKNKDCIIELLMPKLINKTKIAFAKSRFFKLDFIENIYNFEMNKKWNYIEQYPDLSIDNLSITEFYENSFEEQCWKYILDILLFNNSNQEINIATLTGKELLNILEKIYSKYEAFREYIVSYLNNESDDFSDASFTLDDYYGFEIDIETGEIKNEIINNCSEIDKEDDHNNVSVENGIDEYLLSEKPKDETNIELNSEFKISDDWINKATNEQLINIHLFDDKVYSIEDIQKLKMSSIIKIHKAKADSTNAKNERMKKFKKKG